MTEKDTEKVDSGKKRFAWLTWEHSLDIIKVLVTFYAAYIGTFVTMQFNERQHELARMEAIAQMLPHLAQYESQEENKLKSAEQNSPSTPDNNKEKKRTAHMARDGAMWAIFRTANNKTMLRDLASLFPEDIYRVVSSIAASGALKNDPEAVMALQVASEKLAGKYSNTSQAELASRLYSQALHLKKNTSGQSDAPVSIIDLNEQDIDGEAPTEEHINDMLVSLNKLADMHKAESENASSLSTGRWTAKQMYKRVRTLGSKLPSAKAKLEVAKADLALANLYLKEHKKETATYYMQEALKLNEDALGKDNSTTSALRQELDAISH
ncbi:MAG: hypothetical protein K2W82_04445 [Candidatus Obscuribacterales bacterium]|nr:hypothetical protein [Candidatus Obscuribacterales bacterium]